MYARVVLGAAKSVPFREVSSIQGCPYRGVPLYMWWMLSHETLFGIATTGVCYCLPNVPVWNQLCPVHSVGVCMCFYSVYINMVVATDALG